MLHVQQLMPLPLFQERLTMLIRQIYTSEQAPGSEGIVLPRELEAARRAARLQRGNRSPQRHYDVTNCGAHP